MTTAVPIYRFPHIERAIGMVLKAVGLPPRGKLSDITARVFWGVVQRRKRRLMERAAATPGLRQAA